MDCAGNGARIESPPPRRRGAFSLVELLTVVAIIGLLVGILIPTTLGVRISAKRAKTKVQFTQWGGAMGQFRQEYGHYPAIDGGSGGKVLPDLFAGALTGLSFDGTRAAAGSQIAGNTRLLRFYDIAESELSENRTELVDAFGNIDIAVIYDKNGDGMIGETDGTVTAVRGQGSAAAFLPASADLDLTAGIRTGVVFYSAGQGAAPSDLVFSWK